VEKGYSASSLSQAYSAIKYLYRETLKMPLTLGKLRGPRKTMKLPVVLSREEVKAIFKATENDKHRMILMVIYAGGLRVSEASHLRVQEIYHPKGDRQFADADPGGTGEREKRPIHPAFGAAIGETSGVLADLQTEALAFSLQPEYEQPDLRHGHTKVFLPVKKKARITKPVSVHTLRHSFATHLLEQGVNLFTIQKLLGHKQIQNTLIYLHLQQDHCQNIVNPIDGMLGGA
jgi:site-specific recombinase XerD